MNNKTTTLTLRNVDVELIEKIKSEARTPSAAKAFIYLATSYIKLVPEVSQLRHDLNNIRQVCNSMGELVNERRDLEQRISDIDKAINQCLTNRKDLKNGRP